MRYIEKKMLISLHQCLKNILKSKQLKTLLFVNMLAIIVLINLVPVMAEPGDSVIYDYLNENGKTTDIVKLIVVLTTLTILPAIVLTMTVFPRILIVLSFTRSAMGTQQTPPNQVLIGIALILCFFVMSPIITEIKAEAYDPYMAGDLKTEEAFDKAMKPMRQFMFDKAKTEPQTINFFLGLAGKQEVPETIDDIPSLVLMMSFITSELKKAFIMGFIIYIPFIVIDMIVASVLMAMGMMMIPPTTISLPFKILLFIIVDGWTLLFKTLVTSFG
ncbi:flagellar type III secretion system pore protein FliP [Clostridium sp. 'deep sea']|uniref:flagellar type III secretion system pore protein FliP n=1 Tax=Clostridium sp. 'deep sea' TaxID=2779445 RepID=UPI001FAE18CD|nr:flagellar type III secretion system pore protein FliP [Clostridium sp. 'deep sea']